MRNENHSQICLTNSFDLSKIIVKGGISMPDKEKEKRLRAVNIAKAINSIEGVPIPDETNEFFRQWIDGEISDDQLTEVMLSLCKRISYQRN